VDCLTRDTGNGTHTDTIHPAAPLFWLAPFWHLTFTRVRQNMYSSLPNAKYPPMMTMTCGKNMEMAARHLVIPFVCHLNGIPADPGVHKLAAN